MFVMCLCMANYASASNNDDGNNLNGSEDFNKMKHAWLKRFESENKTEEKNEIVENVNQDLVKHQELFKNLKNELITEAKRMKEERIKKTVEQNILENENNKFLQLFNMGTISHNVISCLDLQSVVCLQKVSKKAHSKTVFILEKFPQLAQKFLNIDLPIYNGILQLCGNTALNNNANCDQDFQTGSLFLLRELSAVQQNNIGLNNPINYFQKLICEETPNWATPHINFIEEQFIEPLFVQQLVLHDEIQMGWKKLFKQMDDLHAWGTLKFETCFPLMLNFVLKKGFSVSNNLFMEICSFGHLKNFLPAIKLILKNKFDVNQKFDAEHQFEDYRNKMPIEILETRYKENHTENYLNLMLLLIENGANVNSLEENTLLALLEKNEKK